MRSAKQSEHFNSLNSLNKAHPVPQSLTKRLNRINFYH